MMNRTELALHRRHTVGMVFQSFNLIPSRTALDNVMLALTFGGTPRRKRKVLASEVLDRLGLNTRMYFGDEPQANAADPLLGRIHSAARRDTLIASRGGPEPAYCFDIHLQGASETVFLDI